MKAKQRKFCSKQSFLKSRLSSTCPSPQMWGRRKIARKGYFSSGSRAVQCNSSNLTLLSSTVPVQQFWLAEQSAPVWTICETELQSTFLCEALFLFLLYFTPRRWCLPCMWHPCDIAHLCQVIDWKVCLQVLQQYVHCLALRVNWLCSLHQWTLSSVPVQWPPELTLGHNGSPWVRATRWLITSLAWISGNSISKVSYFGLYWGVV